jgi:hypothetical protein
MRLHKELKNLTITLITKNYPLHIINHHISKALVRTQTELIKQQKPLQDIRDNTTNQIPIILPNDNIGRELAQMITKHWTIIRYDPELTRILQPTLLKVLSNHKSLHDLLISTKHTPYTHTTTNKRPSLPPSRHDTNIPTPNKLKKT